MEPTVNRAATYDLIDAEEGAYEISYAERAHQLNNVVNDDNMSMSTPWASASPTADTISHLLSSFVGEAERASTRLGAACLQIDTALEELVSSASNSFLPTTAAAVSPPASVVRNATSYGSMDGSQAVV